MATVRSTEHFKYISLGRPSVTCRQQPESRPQPLTLRHLGLDLKIAIGLREAAIAHNHSGKIRVSMCICTGMRCRSGCLDGENSVRKMKRVKARIAAGRHAIAASAFGKPRQLPPRIADAFFHIGQEAVANAIRHADPHHLEIALFFQKNQVALSVRDDGSGFVKSGGLLGFGLRGMRKRAAAISAKLEIASQVGAGTCITVTAQLPPGHGVATLWAIIRRKVSERLSHAYSEQ